MHFSQCPPVGFKIGVLRKVPVWDIFMRAQNSSVLSDDARVWYRQAVQLELLIPLRDIGTELVDSAFLYRAEGKLLPFVHKATIITERTFHPLFGQFRNGEQTICHA